MQITVHPDPKNGAVLRWGKRQQRRCAVGRSGIAIKQAEGDGVTPVGTFLVRRIFYRADRLARPQTSLPAALLQPDDGWCTAPADPNYNHLVKLPYPASTEKLWHEDHHYDVAAIVGFNDDPVVPGKGSAIFLHVAQEDYAPTEGCIALTLPDLLDVLALFAPNDTIAITI